MVIIIANAEIVEIIHSDDEMESENQSASSSSRPPSPPPLQPESIEIDLTLNGKRSSILDRYSFNFDLSYIAFLDRLNEILHKKTKLNTEVLGCATKILRWKWLTVSKS